MRIKFELDTESAEDIGQLQALVGVLAGRYTSQAAEFAVRPAATEHATIPTGDQAMANLAGLTPSSAGEWATPPSSVTVPPLESTSNPEGAPVFDSRGFPWDERIHTGTKATNADGTWRNKRGVDKDLVATVEAELRGEPAAPAAAQESGDGSAANIPAPAPTAPPPPPPPPAPVATESGVAAAAPATSEIPNPPAPAAPVADGGIPAAPPAPTPAGVPTFVDVMNLVKQRQQPNGPLSPAEVTQAAVTLGLSSLIELNKPENAAIIPTFMQLIG